MVLLIGTLAAITIPAFEDYNMRTKMSEAVFEMGEYKSAVSQYYADKQQLPVTGAEVALPAAPVRASERPRYTSAISIARGGVVVGVLAGNVDKKLTGQAIMLVPRAKGPDLTWDCGVQSEAMLRFMRMDCHTVMPLP
jgi:type IV pilus assembly protein PilA